jgi:hypothetical protein
MEKDSGLTLDDETETGKKRTEERYVAKARARMAEAELILKNISLHGGCVQSGEFIAAAPNGKNIMSILPEEESNINEFNVDIISKWIRLNRKKTESGFMIISPDESKLLEKYVEYLRNKE